MPHEPRCFTFRSNLFPQSVSIFFPVTQKDAVDQLLRELEGRIPDKPTKTEEGDSVRTKLTLNYLKEEDAEKAMEFLDAKLKELRK